MTDPEHQILALHLQNLHELIRTVDLRLRRIEAALGFMAETGRIQPLGRLGPGLGSRPYVHGRDEPDAV